jgi:hypothetical protein
MMDNKDKKDEMKPVATNVKVDEKKVEVAPKDTTSQSDKKDPK